MLEFSSAWFGITPSGAFVVVLLLLLVFAFVWTWRL
jgi:hypothetical protein